MLVSGPLRNDATFVRVGGYKNVNGGGMRTQLLAFLVMASLAAVPAGAQETRGNINGTVQDASGVIPGATVTIINVDTGQTQTLAPTAPATSRRRCSRPDRIA